MSIQEKMVEQQKRLPNGFHFEEGDDHWLMPEEEDDDLIRFTVYDRNTTWSKSYSATQEGAGWELAFAVDDARREVDRRTDALRKRIRGMGLKSRASLLMRYRDEGRDALIDALKGECHGNRLGADCDEIADEIIDRTIWN